MPVFLTLSDADITNPAFWTALDIGPDSTLDATGISDTVNITLTGTSISFTDTATNIVTTYTDADLRAGSFSAFVEVRGNDGSSNLSGADGLNASGYVAGAGDDVLRDDGSLGGQLDGGDGDDTLIGGSGSNNIEGRDGDDVLRGGGGNNNLRGGDGDDTLFADDGSGNLIGGDGDDVVYAGPNTTFTSGGAGDDTLLIPPGATFRPFFPGATGGQVILPDGRSFTYLDYQAVDIACFTAGTPVATPDGEVAIDRLRVGDLVQTLDHGPQPVRWIGRRTVCGAGALAPVSFAPGIIGNAHKLQLSQQHRVLMSGWKCELLFAEPEVLCAAAMLCDGDGIWIEPCVEVTYVHVMFDRHEILLSQGARLESFYVGERITSEDLAVHQELLTLFPEIAGGRHGASHPARPFLRRFEVETLLA